MEKEDKKEKKFIDFLKTEEGKKLTKPFGNYCKEVQKLIKPFIDYSKKINKSIEILIKGLQRKFAIESKKQPFIHTEQNQKMIDFTGKNLKWAKKVWVMSFAMLLLTSIFFLGQLYIQHKLMVNELIYNLESLEIELEKNLEIANMLLNNQEIIEESIISTGFVKENLRKAISNGKIRNQSIKEKLFVLDIGFSEANNNLKMINSPEFVLTEPESWERRKKGFATNLLGSIEENLKPNINCLKKEIETYQKCIQDKNSFNKC